MSDALREATALIDDLKAVKKAAQDALPVLRETNLQSGSSRAGGRVGGLSGGLSGLGGGGGSRNPGERVGGGAGVSRALRGGGIGGAFAQARQKIGDVGDIAQGLSEAAAGVSNGTGAPAGALRQILFGARGLGLFRALKLGAGGLAAAKIALGGYDLTKEKLADLRDEGRQRYAVADAIRGLSAVSGQRPTISDAEKRINAQTDYEIQKLGVVDKVLPSAPLPIKTGLELLGKVTGFDLMTSQGELRRKAEAQIQEDAARAKESIQRGMEDIANGDLRAASGSFLDANLAVPGAMPMWYSPGKVYQAYEAGRVANRNYARSLMSRAGSRTGD